MALSRYTPEASTKNHHFIYQNGSGVSPETSWLVQFSSGGAFYPGDFIPNLRWLNFQELKSRV
jgi:hypothetical protein